jgi:nitroreductase
MLNNINKLAKSGGFKMNEVITLMKSHSSVRKFIAEPVEDSLVAELVQAGQHASTSNHIQAYTIIRVRNHKQKEVLAQLCGDQEYVKNCPVFLVFCADLHRLKTACSMNQESMNAGSSEAFLLATVDTALVAQNIMVAAEAVGLGGVYIGGIRNNPQQVCELLKIPQHVYPVFGMCLGYPEKRNAVKPRLPLSLVLKEEFYTTEGDDASLLEYDRIISEYYRERTAGKRSNTWSQGVTSMMKTKLRPHMKTFLASKGLDID